MRKIMFEIYYRNAYTSPAILISNEDGGHRIIGDKLIPFQTPIHRFEIDADELIKIINEYAFEELLNE